MSDGFIVVLSWPNPKLSPNARVHWAQKSTLKKKQRAEALERTSKAYSAMFLHESGLFERDVPCRIDLVFRPPNQRKRDADNVIASLKAALDGVAEAIGVDDHLFTVSYQWDEVAAPDGCIVVAVYQPKPQSEKET